MEHTLARIVLQVKCPGPSEFTTPITLRGRALLRTDIESVGGETRVGPVCGFPIGNVAPHHHPAMR